MRSSKAAAVAVLLCVMSLVAAACGGSSASPGSAGSPAPGGSSSAGATSPGGTTPAPSGSTGPGSVTPSSGAAGEAPGAWTIGTTNASTNERPVSCATPTYCLNPPNVWNGTTWAAMTAQPSTGAPTIITCFAANDCRAMSNDNFNVWNGSTWKESKNFYSIGTTQGGVSIVSMSCPTTTFCAAADITYGYAFTWDGSKWSEPTTIDPAAAANTAAVNAGSTSNLEYLSIACASPAFCAAIDTDGNATTFNGTTWTKPVKVAAKPQGQAPPPLACPSATYCLASVAGGFTVWDGSSWSAPRSIAPAGFPANNPAFGAVSCAGSTFCMVIGTPVTDWGIFNGSTFLQGAKSVGIQQPSGLSCATTDFCMTIGPYGYATWHP